MLSWVSGGLPSIPVRTGEVMWPQLTPEADMGQPPSPATGTFQRLCWLELSLTSQASQSRTW